MNLINEKALLSHDFRIVNARVQKCQLVCEYSRLSLKIRFIIGEDPINVVDYMIPTMANFPKLDKEDHRYEYWTEGLPFLAKLMHEIFCVYDFNNIPGSFVRLGISNQTNETRFIGHIVRDEWIKVPKYNGYDYWLDECDTKYEEEDKNES